MYVPGWYRHQQRSVCFWLKRMGYVTELWRVVAVVEELRLHHGCHLNLSGLLRIIFFNTPSCWISAIFFWSEMSRLSIRFVPLEKTTVLSGRTVFGAIVDIGVIVQFFYKSTQFHIAHVDINTLPILAPLPIRAPA